MTSHSDIAAIVERTGLTRNTVMMRLRRGDAPSSIRRIGRGVGGGAKRDIRREALVRARHNVPGDLEAKDD